MWASIFGHFDVVDLLVKAGADIDKENKRGYSALQFALEYQHVDIIDYLILIGISIDFGFVLDFIKWRLRDNRQVINRSRILSIFKLFYHKFIFLSVEGIFDLVQTLLNEKMYM